MRLGVRSKFFLISLLLLSITGLTALAYLNSQLSSLEPMLSPSDYQLVSDRLIHFLVLAGGVGLVVAIIMSAIASHLVARLVKDLLETAKGMLKGQLPPMEISKRKDELGSIARTLRQIADEFENLLDTLTHERDQFRAVLQGMEPGVIGLDADNKITLINRSARTLLAIEGNPIERPIVEVTREPSLIHLIRGDHTEKSHETECQLGGPPTRTLLARITPQRISGDSILVLQDITALRRLEAARQDFVANVSHELRTPVSIIQGAAENLEDGALADEIMARRFTATILRNSQRLSLLISDLLELSQLDSGTTQLKQVPVGLYTLAESICEDLKERAVTKQVQILLDVSPEHQVMADPNGMEQVFTNLIDNALKYGASPGQIHVQSKVTPNGVQVQIIDDGPGVAPSHRVRVFERFFRVDPGRARKDGGTGLGLAIVKHLILGMNGTIWLDEGPNGGCAFTFELPSANPTPNLSQNTGPMTS